MLLLETLTQAEQEVCNAEEGLSETLSNKFKLQCNESIKSLLFCKLVRQHYKNVEEWIGKLRIVTIECNYKEIGNRKNNLYMD